jgi:ATP-dependent helicase Lhr and Lhr-like helicase
MQQMMARPKNLMKCLHPRIAQWFQQTYPAFTDAQLCCVPAILAHESILLTSPTGSGKTLAGFLGVFDFLLRKLDAGTLPSSVQCIYVSPLRALAYDIGKNLRGPIVGMGLDKKLGLHLRTGDTPPAERMKFRQRPTHFLVTTPESLAVMLAQESYGVPSRGIRFDRADGQLPTVEAYRQATHTFLEADSAYQFLDDVQTFDWKLLEVPVVSPFSFAIYASVIKENMMLEDPASAIERIYREMYAKVESTAAGTNRNE